MTSQAEVSQSPTLVQNTGPCKRRRSATMTAEMGAGLTFYRLSQSA